MTRAETRTCIYRWLQDAKAQIELSLTQVAADSPDWKTHPLEEVLPRNVHQAQVMLKEALGLLPLPKD